MEASARMASAGAKARPALCPRDSVVGPRVAASHQAARRVRRPWGPSSHAAPLAQRGGRRPEEARAHGRPAARPRAAGGPAVAGVRQGALRDARARHPDVQRHARHGRRARVRDHVPGRQQTCPRRQCARASPVLTPLHAFGLRQVCSCCSRWITCAPVVPLVPRAGDAPVPPDHTLRPLRSRFSSVRALRRRCKRSELRSCSRSRR